MPGSVCDAFGGGQRLDEGHIVQDITHSIVALLSGQFTDMLRKQHEDLLQRIEMLLARAPGGHIIVEDERNNLPPPVLQPVGDAPLMPIDAQQSPPRPSKGYLGINDKEEGRECASDIITPFSQAASDDVIPPGSNVAVHHWACLQRHQTLSKVAKKLFPSHDQRKNRGTAAKARSNRQNAWTNVVTSPSKPSVLVAPSDMEMSPPIPSFVSDDEDVSEISTTNLLCERPADQITRPTERIEVESSVGSADMQGDRCGFRANRQTVAGKGTIIPSFMQVANTMVDTVWSGLNETKADQLNRKTENIRSSAAANCDTLSEYQRQPEQVASDTPKSGLGCAPSLRRIVKGHAFELFFGFAIITNSIWMGVEVDWTAHNPRAGTPTEFVAVGYIFAALFLLELVLRVAVDRLQFFWANGREFLWNYLDMFIVGSSLFEIVLDLLAFMRDGEDTGEEELDGGGVNAANLRIVRIIRVARLMRLFRIGRIVRFIRALRTLVFSIICTLKSVFWSMMLLFIIIYVFGIVFTQATSDYVLAWEVGGDSKLAPEMYNKLCYHYGNLADAMLTLFMSICGGVSWFDVVRPLRGLGIMWSLTFYVFIAFTYFAVLNVVTGVFCQSAIESSKMDQEAMVQAVIMNKQFYISRFKALFQAIDSDNSGSISKEEFEEHLHDPRVQAFFASLELEATDALNLFKLLETDLDHEDDDDIDVEDFVMGCLRLKGYAKSCDMAVLMKDNKQLYRELVDFAAYAEDQFELINRGKVQHRGQVMYANRYQCD